MPNGIQFDYAGNMSAVSINGEQAASEMRELIGCTHLVPIRITNNLTLVLDAEGADHVDAKVNHLLTAAATLLGHDEPLYGIGLFVGSLGDDGQVIGISDTARLDVVLAAIQSPILSH